MAPLSHHFESAVIALVGEGPVKKRLLCAFDHNLESLRVGDLPEEIQADFESLLGALTQVSPSGKETPAAASVRKMSIRDADQYAAAIVRMYARILRLASESSGSERLTVLNGGRKPPKFLRKDAH